MKKSNTSAKAIILLIVFMITGISVPANAQSGKWKPAYNDNGYASPCSLTKGDTIRFYISTNNTPFSIQIFQLGLTEKQIATYSNIEGGHRETPDSAFANGCGWPVSFTLKIPDTWKAGAYAARFPVDTGRGTSTVLFFVKEKNPGSTADIVLVIPYFNWVAYNTYGGKNVYDENSTEMKRAYKVSFERPFFGGGYAEFRSYPYKMIHWLEANKYKYEVITEFDVHKYPGILDNYKVAIEAGHAEYWTKMQWINVEKYIQKGGKYLSLSGNTCWWQVRIDEDENALICYKNKDLDPLYHKVDSLVTVNWFDKPLNLPENLLLGASFRNAGYVDDINHKDFTHAQGYGGYSAHNTQHWIFSNTGLKEGDLFGRDPKDSLSSIVGYETDGALFKWEYGLPSALGTDGTPKNFRILGISPAIGQGDTVENRYATMGLYYTKKQGLLFNSSTIYWVYGLPKDPVVQTITKNIIDKSLQNRFPPEIISWSPYKLDTVTVNHQLYAVNRRECDTTANDTVSFRLQVADPYGENVKYEWYTDSLLLSRDSVFNFVKAKEGIYTVKVLVFNSKDTSTVSWKVDVAAPTAIRPGKQIAFKYDLQQNYPNPFNPVTNFKYSLAEESSIKLVVYNTIGQVIKVLADKVEKAGNYNLKWEPAGISSGIYFYALEASAVRGTGNFRAVRKMVYLK
ncbi:MAG: N,N-dimethylformamidase beta subunit family domain-containing protein [Syntrophothermus sp.]